MNFLPPDQPEPTSLAELDATWSARKTYWARKLGRLRLGVEPIEEQLAKYRRVTWMLTAIPAFFSAFLFTLFAVFRRPDIGLVAAAILFLPIIAGAWLGDFLRNAPRSPLSPRAGKLSARPSPHASNRDRRREIFSAPRVKRSDPSCPSAMCARARSKPTIPLPRGSFRSPRADELELVFLVPAVA